MRILFDLGHASHYYFFKPAIGKLRDRGDEIGIVVRNREGLVSKLLTADGEEFTTISRDVGPGVLRKAFRMIINDVSLLRFAAKWRPDVLVSAASPYSGFASFFLRKPHIIYDDTEVAQISQLLVLPFTTTMITPTSYDARYRIKNLVRTDGYKVLAYLNPSRFHPNPTALSESGLAENEKFTMIRFSSYDGSHDFGLTGLSSESRKRLVRELMKFSKVVISSEVELEPELKEYEYRLRPERILDVLNYAALYVGEGATMACEAAVLGVPSIFIHRNTAGILEDLEKEGLLRSFHRPNEDLEEIISLSTEMLKDPSYRVRQKDKSAKLLRSKEDPTDIIMREIDRQRRTN